MEELIRLDFPSSPSFSSGLPEFLCAAYWLGADLSLLYPQDPERVSEFRPISLCNVSYRLLSKALANPTFAYFSLSGAERIPER